MSDADSVPGRAPGPLDRFLRLFTEVRAGEGSTALLLTLNVFVLLTAYYILKPVREALILVGGGAEVKSYAAAGQGLLLLAAVPLYARLASRLPRRQLIPAVTLFFAGCLVVFYVLARYQVPLGVAFYLWVGIFNLMVIAQFWSFANDVYTQEEGKRLFPIVAFGASSGAVWGSFVSGRLIGPLGVYEMLLVAGALLLLGLVLTALVEARQAHPRSSLAAAAAPSPAPLGRGGAFRLVAGNRYLLLIALLMLVLNWVNTTGEYLLGKVVSGAAAEAVAAGAAGGLSRGEYIGAFYADFFAVVNLVGLLVRLFAVSRIIKYAGMPVALIVLPAIALGGYAFLAAYPLLAVVRWAKTAENATDYSLQNTVRQALFLPTTREEKYKAKQAIDTFFVRAGDVLSAALVYTGVNWFAFGVRQFALVNLALVAVWLGLAAAIGRGYERLTRAAAGPRAPGP
ncbi:MAG: translocase [Gemmatimonadota bacterium]